MDCCMSSKMQFLDRDPENFAPDEKRETSSHHEKVINIGPTISHVISLNSHTKGLEGYLRLNLSLPTDLRGLPAAVSLRDLRGRPSVAVLLGHLPEAFLRLSRTWAPSRSLSPTTKDLGTFHKPFPDYQGLGHLSKSLSSDYKGLGHLPDAFLD